MKIMKHVKEFDKHEYDGILHALHVFHGKLSVDVVLYIDFWKKCNNARLDRPKNIRYI